MLSPARLNVLAAGLGCWLLLQIAVLMLFLRGGPEVWYFPLPLSIGFLLGVRVAEDCSNRFALSTRRVLVAGTLAASLALAGFEIAVSLSRDWHFRSALAISRWIDANLPPGTRIYQVDNAGIVGYFSNRAVINGDGVINGWEYQRFLREGRLTEYLAAKRVDYVLWDEYYQKAAVEIPVPLWNGEPLLMTFRGSPDAVARFGRFLLIRLDVRNLALGRAARCPRAC
jgi:hypothetical protein